MIPGVDDTDDEDDKEEDDKKKQHTEEEKYPRCISTSLIRSWYIWPPTVRYPITQ